LRPWARRSGMITRKPSAAMRSAAPNLIQFILASENRPWSKTTGRPCPTSWYASSTPSDAVQRATAASGIADGAKLASRILDVAGPADRAEEGAAEHMRHKPDRAAHLHQQDHAALRGVVPHLVREGIVENEQLAVLPAASLAADFDPAIAGGHLEPKVAVEQGLAHAL